MRSIVIILASINLLILPVVNCQAQSDTGLAIHKATFTITKQHAPNTWQQMHLKGRVQSIIVRDRDQRSAKLDTTLPVNYASYTFDTAGYLTEETESRPCDGCLNYKSITKSFFKYDGLGFKIRQTDYNQDNKITDTILFFWNENGMEEHFKCSSFPDYKKAFYRYNKEGKIIECDMYDYKGKVEGKHLYKYTDKSITEQIILSGQTLNTYDINGVLLQSNIGQDVITYSYKYDNYGNWVVQKQYFDKKLSQTIKREIKYY